MKCHYDVFLAPEIAELHFQLPFALNRWQLKIRSRVSHFQRHSRLPPPANTIRIAPRFLRSVSRNESSPGAAAKRLCCVLFGVFPVSSTVLFDFVPIFSNLHYKIKGI